VLEDWRRAKEAATPGVLRLRTHRPPPLHLGTALRRVLRGHESFGANSVALSADGTTIVSGSDDKTVRVWDAASGAERRALGMVRLLRASVEGFRGDQSVVTSVTLSAEGTTIVTGSVDGMVRVWDAASGVLERQVLRGHEGSVLSVALSADGTTIVSASRDNTVRIWDAASGECREVIQGTGDVEAIAAGPSRFPFRALRRGLETATEDAATAAPVAWFPVPLDHI
jgi:WD40 repeat protein